MNEWLSRWLAEAPCLQAVLQQYPGYVIEIEVREDGEAPLLICFSDQQLSYRYQRSPDGL